MRESDIAVTGFTGDAATKPIAARRTGPGLQHKKQKKLTTPSYSGVMLSGLALFNIKWGASRWLLVNLKRLAFAFQSSSFLNLSLF